VLLFDFSAGGMDFDKLWQGPGLPFAGSLIMILFDIFLYLFLAYYLDNVVPSEYGTKRKPWFIFQKSFWVRQYRPFKFNPLSPGENVVYNDDVCDNPDVEPVSSDLLGKAAVRICNLKKVFYSNGKEPVNAVDGITLDIYESQITAILGHNGAGKSTLFNILTGMTAPTYGTASVFGLDIREADDMTDIRRMTGVCPQHDIIFMSLTPREHLSFFARIRGIPENRINTEVEKTLEEVDLLLKADSKAADLSGGQKRKLSISIALIGDPKIIFLDEPTAGVDAYSRRRLWALLKSRKEGKVILLTTHFMDEADILADRKAIISRGKLRCCGSSLFLKNKFGLGYHLTLIVDENTEPSNITRIVQDVISDSQLARHSGKEMSFILPTDSTKLFPSLFLLLDRHIKGRIENVGIEGYGISMTTLEEVFFTLSDENEGGELHCIDDLGKHLIRERSPSTSPVHHASPVPILKTDRVVTTDMQGFAIETVEARQNDWRAFKALFKLRFINTLRDYGALIIMIVMPLVFTTLSIYIGGNQVFSLPTDELLSLTPGIYGSSLDGALFYNNTGHNLNSVEAIFQSSNISVDTYQGKYLEIFQLRPHVTSWSVNSFPHTNQFEVSVNMTMGFNDTYIHSIPMLMNLLSNSLMR
ncbi:ATP-binding cassette sub- A member 5, partial [Halocaridina rubra]